MKVLFIGGTGVISSACAPLAIEKGIDVYLLTRGKSFRKPPKGAKLITADIRDPQSVKSALGDQYFDAVVDWNAYTPEHVQTDIDLFRGKTGQYIFISTASAYKTPLTSLPVREDTVVANPVWDYSQQKIKGEDLLINAFRDEQFPMTIVRPSHTYDKTMLPFRGAWTVLKRMKEGKKVIVHGDGTSLWVMTHHRDFAKGFVGLLGNSAAVGEVFHITSDEALTWDQIYRSVAEAAGVEPKLVHVPSEVIARRHKDWGDTLLGDKMHSVVFDNAKIKRFVPDFAATIPYSIGAREVVDYYESTPEAQVVDEEYEAVFEKLIAEYHA